MMNPQFRLFHECVWTALEDAGYDPFEYKGKSVFIRYGDQYRMGYESTSRSGAR
ncbi:beta-ketoacyl synthase N-terminal-like domain-containing protein [Bacillus sp. SL00103]